MCSFGLSDILEKNFRIAIRMVSLGVAFVCISLTHSVFSQDASTGKVAPLKDLKPAFEKARDAIFEPQRELKKNYGKQLSLLLNQVTKKGELEQVLAVEKELVAYKKEESIPAGDDFPELKRLQLIYSEASAEREKAINQKLVSLVGHYRERLLAIQKQFTKEGRIEDALKVKSVMEGIPPIEIPDPANEASKMPGSKESPFENSLGMKFVPVEIPNGPTKGKPILFSIWETRVKDYSAFARSTNREWRKPGFKQTSNHPAVWVQGSDVDQFCNWLTEKERKTLEIGENDRYRLPSDHEWSCAVGIGKYENPTVDPLEKDSKLAEIYPWGENWPPPNKFGNYLGEETKDNWMNGRPPIKGFSDGFRYTAPVGSFAPNKLGLYDLGGNVREWCNYSSKPNGTKPQISRDGSWRHPNAWLVLSSKRWSGSYYDNLGFRCVLEIDADKD